MLQAGRSKNGSWPSNACFKTTEPPGRHSARNNPKKKDGKGIYNPNFILRSFVARFKSLPLEKKTKPR